ncbi:hypothetical protein ACFYYP_32495 [Microbispora rosea]|uniref:Cas10/Cmr2 second palm domain-containing protein n=1 Tax=Microbispora rosea TaxID=58117 RepID=UPI003689C4CE
MPTYLDVGVVRIQSYIARTPDLRLRRGASWLLSDATSASAISEWIGSSPEVAINDDAGDADGVICLRVPPGREEEIATKLLLHLRSRLPGADLQALWATGETYPDARLKMSDPFVALPPVQDFPLANTCEACRVDVRVAGEFCADCVARDQAGGRRTARGESPDALGAEREILAAVNEIASRELRPVRDFGDLAALGDGNGNHLATVALDGNGIGALFASLDGRHKKDISRAISATTRTALIRSAASLLKDSETRLPVIPHVIGGDDIVVTVVADRAWTFTRSFLSQFDAGMTELAQKSGIPEEVRLPTMSAGLVFAHCKFPYARAVHLAEEMLRGAKRDTYGERAAVGWLDVTEDGEAAPHWRRAFPLAEVEHLSEGLRALGKIGKSGRQALQRCLGHRSEEEAMAAAQVWARRNNHPAVGDLLRNVSVADARNLLSITRWWRP